MKAFSHNRLVALLLTLALLCNMGVMPVLASVAPGDVPIGTSTVCPHHTHDESCGFAEGTPCNHVPKVHAENTFADSAKISAYAKDAVKQMQMAGVLAGKSGNLFDSQGTTTRAEVSAAVLRRFIELTISTDTAEGWSMNNSGQWLYYENGEPVTGTKPWTARPTPLMRTA